MNRRPPAYGTQEDEADMDKRQRSGRFGILLIVALMLGSGWLGLHFADRAAGRTPDPSPPVILLPR
jgi:hypothetical protein